MIAAAHGGMEIEDLAENDPNSLRRMTLKRFAFDRNQTTALTFCFFAHFIRKPQHTFRNTL